MYYRNSNIIIFGRYFICATCYLFLFSFSQVRLGEWKALTSPLRVNDLVVVGENIYGATGGGLFILRNDQYKTLTTIDGLDGVNLLSIREDHNSNLWIGGSSPFGFLQIYDPINNQSVNSFDFGLTSILDIQIENFMAWVLFQDGQDFGLMKFIYDDNWEYRDSFRHYPDIAGYVNCFTIKDSTLFLGMSNGLYYSHISNNLKNPETWSKLIPNVNDDITSISMDEDILVFTLNNGIYQYFIETGNLVELDFSYNLEKAENIRVSKEGYWFNDGKNLFLKSNNNEYLIEDKYEINKIFPTVNQTLAGLDNGILFIIEDMENSYIASRFLPNAPVTNSFSAITILDDGRLVGGSSHGISIYNGISWHNILEIKIEGSALASNNYDYNYFVADTIAYDFGQYIADLEQGPDGLLYCAIRGSRVYSANPPRSSGGVIVLDIDDPTNVSTIDTTFLSYHTTSSNSTPYQVTLDISFDYDGNLWIVNPYCINGNNPIHIRSLDGIWKHYGSSETTTRISQSPSSIAFDSWSRVWVSAFQAEEANLGIYPNGGISMLTFEGEPYNPTDFFWDIIKYDGTVWSIAMGLNNRLYYLTPSGLNYYDLENSLYPIIRENSYSYFPNISFGVGSGIAVDKQGNIWTFSPTQGIHILLENTTYWPDINGFRKSNSPLLSDEVRDIAFDEKNNLAYIATNNGVNILKIPFGIPKLNYDGIKIFPSPFYIPSNKPMKVDGLVYESSMMVMTLDGKVIRHIQSQGINNDGDQLSWDGRDKDGYYVSSGVYLLMIYGIDGSHVADKITVINN